MPRKYIPSFPFLMLLVPALVVSSVLEIFNSFVGEGAKDEDDEVGQVNIFKTVHSETINAVSEDGKWEEIQFAVTSSRL